MKLTRSFPANAMARAKVPDRTVIFITLTRVNRVRTWNRTVNPTKLINNILVVCSWIATSI